MDQLLILAVSFVVILAGAELFTNGIEWFGRKLALAAGANFLQAAQLSNIAGGLVVMKRGTATVTGQELEAGIGNT